MSNPKKKPVVYLVIDTGNAPGRVLAVFADKADAEWFAEAVDSAEVEERVIHYGQPGTRGYNK